MKKRGECYITQFFYLNLQTLIFIGKMKQLKFLMVALTLLMGISFTSCLNSDDGEYDDIYGMVLVNNYMGLLSFEDAAGNTYQPTSASVTQFEANSSLKISDSRMGIILGKSIEPETNEKSKTTNFTLKNFQPISFANAVVSMTAESLVVDAPETAPVITLKLENGSVQPFLYNKDILVTPIAGCRISKDVPPYIIMNGNPAEYHGINAAVLQHKHQVTERVLRHIVNAYRLVYQGNFSVQDALQKIEDQVPMSDEIHNIINFIKNSKGIVK